MHISALSRISSSFLRFAIPLSLALSLPCLYAQKSQSDSSAASVLNGQGDANKTFGTQTSLPSANEVAPSARGGGFDGHRAGGPDGESGHERISGHESDGGENGLADGSGAGFGGGQRGRGDRNSYSSAWTRLLVDAFQMGMRSRGLSGGGSGFGSMNVGSLLQMGSRFSQDLGGGHGGLSGGIGTALGVLPKMDRLMNQGLRIPLSSSNGKFQFSYKDQIGAGGNGMGGEIGRGSAQATYSSGLKNDLLHFSAAATFGGMSGGFGSGSNQGATSFGGSGGSGAGIGSSGGGSGMFSGGEGHGGGMSMGGGEGGHGGGMGGGSAGGQAGAGGGHGHSGGGGAGPAVSLRLSF